MKGENVEEALKSEEWSAVADAVYKLLMESNTWELVNQPDGRKPIDCKWIFKVK